MKEEAVKKGHKETAVKQGDRREQRSEEVDDAVVTTRGFARRLLARTSVKKLEEFSDIAL